LAISQEQKVKNISIEFLKKRRKKIQMRADPQTRGLTLMRGRAENLARIHYAGRAYPTRILRVKCKRPMRGGPTRFAIPMH